MSAIIKYNNITLEPTPFVSRSMEPVDAGALRIGFVRNYELDGYVEIDNLNYGKALEKFNVSPAELDIDGKKERVFVTSFSIGDTAFDFQGKGKTSTFIPYSVKFKCYEQLPDEIKNPLVEYSYSEDEKRVVTLTIKTSAEGLTSVEKAREFVDKLVEDYGFTTTEGKSIFLNTSVVAANSVPPRNVQPSKNWALVSTKRGIDRTKFSYSIERVFKRNMGGIEDKNFKFFETVAISQSLSLDGDYKSYDFDVNLKILCEEADDNNRITWKSIESSIGSQDYIKKIVDHYLPQHKIAITSRENINNLSFTKNESANEMTLKFALLDTPLNDFKGYFDYTVSTDYDMSADTKSVTLEGEFVSKGDLVNRRRHLQKWIKGDHPSDGYSVPQKESGPDFKEFAKNQKNISTVIDISKVIIDKTSVDYNPSKAEFRLSCSLDDVVRNSEEFMSFNVDGKFGMPIYKFSNSANIEGHFIVEDFQCKSLETISVSANGKSAYSNKTAMDASMVIATSAIKNVFNVHRNGRESFKDAVPESNTVSEIKNDSSFEMNLSAMYIGTDYSFTTFLKNTPQPSASFGKRFGR